MPVLFITNPLSARIMERGSQLEKISTQTGIPHYTLENFADLPQIVDHAVKTNVQHIFIEGGDGTMHGVLTAFLNSRKHFKAFPNFTLIPGGMTNQIAKNVGVKNPSQRKIKTLLKNVSGRAHQCPMLKITSADTPPLYGFLLSTGAVPQVTDYTKTRIHTQGIGGSAAVLGGIVKAVMGKRSDVMWATPLSLKSASQLSTKSGLHLGTLVTTLPGLILRLDPFWGTEDGPLRILYAGGETRHLPRNILGLWCGFKSKDRSADDLYSWNADRLEYDYDGPIVLDGERLDFRAQPFSVDATEPLTFIT